MQTSRLHRSAWAVASITLLLIITGAINFSNSSLTHPATQALTPLQWVHRGLAVIVGLLTISLVFWGSKVPNRPSSGRWAGQLGWSALGLVVVQVALGFAAPSAAVLHAILAQLFFGLTIAIIVATSAAWSKDGDLVDDHMRLPMRTLANITLLLVLIQIVLGASVRHKLLNVVSHMGFAVLVALSAMILGMCVLQQAPDHRKLRSAAVHLMVIVGIQVFLGFSAFVLQVMDAETALAGIIVITAHVTTAALTLGATVMLTLEIQHYMRAAAPQREGARPTVAS
jgi:heme A synthase